MAVVPSTTDFLWFLLPHIALTMNVPDIVKVPVRGVHLCLFKAAIKAFWLDNMIGFELYRDSNTFATLLTSRVPSQIFIGEQCRNLASCIDFDHSPKDSLKIFFNNSSLIVAFMEARVAVHVSLLDIYTCMRWYLYLNCVKVKYTKAVLNFVLVANCSFR